VQLWVDLSRLIVMGWTAASGAQRTASGANLNRPCAPDCVEKLRTPISRAILCRCQVRQRSNDSRLGPSLNHCYVKSMPDGATPTFSTQSTRQQTFGPGTKRQIFDH
jgi:hypothetical protein